MFFSIGKPTETVHPRRVVSLAELGPAGRPRFNQRIFVKRAGRNRLALPGTFDEVIGVDFWHAVEFSRFGRTPSPAWLFRVNRRRGNPLTIPSGLWTVKLVAAREGGQRMESKARTIPPVSYTHLDVYKRQAYRRFLRPSSVPGAKASTVRPYKLGHKDARVHCVVLKKRADPHPPSA